MSVGLGTAENTRTSLNSTIHCVSIRDQSFTVEKIKEDLALSSKGMSLKF